MAYGAKAPTHPHLGWTPGQVEAYKQRTQSAGGRQLSDVLQSMEEYKVPKRGLNNIPPELFTDVHTRLNSYIRPVQQILGKYAVTDPAKINSPQAWQNAARQAVQARNQLMEAARENITDHGRQASQSAKAQGISFESAMQKAEQAMLKDNPDAFKNMSATQRQVAIAKQVVTSAGKTDPTFNALAQGADDASRGLKALKTGGRTLGAVGAVVDGISLGSEIQTSMQTGNWHNTGKEASRVAGGWMGAAAAGAVVGAASGTVVPVIGNIGGFLVGAAAGAAGYWLGSSVAEAGYQALTH